MNLLSVNGLKAFLQRDFSRQHKALLILASFDGPRQVLDIKDRAAEAGSRRLSRWNVADVLRRMEGLAIRTPEGWEITSAGWERLRGLGIAPVTPAAVVVGEDLRELISQVEDGQTRAFVREAVGCYEAGFFRSAIVMSWVAAVDVLRKHVLQTSLKRFNTEARRRNPKWRAAKTVDDLGNMREADFLECISALSIIGGDVKKALRECLDRRNSCGHPNSLTIAGASAAHHLDILLRNVFTVFL